MSTSTYLESGPEHSAAAPRERLVSGPLAWVFLSSFAAMTSFELMLSVTPMYAAAAGGGSAGAGLVTGVLLLGTVGAELAATPLMRRYRHRTLLMVAAALMGIPALALLAGAPLPVIAAVSVVRGFGFGLCTVVMATLTALLLPPERRGEGLGLSGVVDSLPGVVALPAGVWLADRYGFAVVVLLTAVTGLAPVAAFRWLPGTSRPPPLGRPGGDRAARGPATGRRAAAGPHLRRDHGGGRRGGLLPPAGGRRLRRRRGPRPAGAGADRDGWALVGGMARRPARSRRAC